MPEARLVPVGDILPRWRAERDKGLVYRGTPTLWGEIGAGGLKPLGKDVLRIMPLAGRMLGEHMAEWTERGETLARLRLVCLPPAVQISAAEKEAGWVRVGASGLPSLRAQEHSAQIPRPVLKDYEQDFKDGKINVLNCTTTMEMGVDIPNVALVINANVPPSVANYRQRVGRAGRREEPFAFAATFCRDLPWDRIAFEAPARYLAAKIAAPAVRLDSPRLVARHVHAALLGAFLRALPEGFSIQTSVGAFFGTTDNADEPVASDAPVEAFFKYLGESFDRAEFSDHLQALTYETALAERAPPDLAAETSAALEALAANWRNEYRELLARAAGATEVEVKAAFTNRARRMRGEFLLSELARRGFTPSYGFPVDVVWFDHLLGHEREHQQRGEGAIAFGEQRGTPARTLDVAIREYAPGSEIVVDGLVHLSEGIMPAWNAHADASGLEDLQQFWECEHCHAFGLERAAPEACPACAAANPRWRRALRPVGFLGRRPPHTGYESLGHVPYEMPRVHAMNAPWQALPDPEAGRLRADPTGEVLCRRRSGRGCY